MSENLKGKVICIGIAIFFIAFAATLLFTTKKNILDAKTKIKQELYLRDKEHYQDEYVDLWFDLQNNKYYSDINNSYHVYTDKKDITELEKMDTIIDKLINVYGKDFHTLIPQNPLMKPDKEENGKPFWLDTNTLIWFKKKLQYSINNNKERIELNKKREALTDKIVYGKD